MTIGLSQEGAVHSTLNLFCLPYAGGSATIYREWPAHLPRWIKLIPLHMPGRGVRQQLAPMHRWPELLDLLLEDMRPDLDQPFAIFGHSMGALVGLELAHAIRRRYGLSPLWFGASACAAPARREPGGDWLTCPESAVLEQMRSLNGTPEELLLSRDLMNLVLPFMRADFHLCGSYAYRQRPPLACPVLALGSNSDDVSLDPTNLSAWSLETSGPFVKETLDAGHFFINTHRDTLIELLVASLKQAVTAPRRRLTAVAA
jgi:surfactin synthase thioesterase subunit